MATVYDNLPLPTADQYPYNLQGDQTAVRQLSQSAQAGNASALEKLRTLGLNEAGGISNNSTQPSSQSYTPVYSAPQASSVPTQPQLNTRPQLEFAAVPATAPNYSAGVNPVNPDRFKAQQPFVDPKLQLQRDKLDFEKKKFSDAQARYADQQAAAANRLKAQQEQAASQRAAGPASRGGGGGSPGAFERPTMPTITDGIKTPPKPAPKAGGGKGGGKGGGGGGGKREPTTAELTRQMDRKNRAKEKSDQKARDRDDDRSVHGNKDKWGRDYKDYGSGAFEKWQKDNEERRRKEDNERRAEAEKERKRKDKEPPQPNKPNPNPEAGIGADAMWDSISDAMPRTRMTHAYGNKHAKMVRARGDLAA